MSLALPLLLVFATVAVAQVCYLPDGSPSTKNNTFACKPDVAASHCCQGIDICTTNGLCKAPHDLSTVWIYRTTCTDQTWQSSACPQYCRSSENGLSQTENGDAREWLMKGCSATTYCCTYDSDIGSQDCCQDGTRILTLGRAVLLAVGNITSSDSSGTSDEEEEGGQEASATSGPQDSDATGTSNNNAAEMPNATPRDGFSTGAIVGVGVGAGLGVALLVVLAAFFGKRLMRRRQTSENSETSFSNSPERLESHRNNHLGSSDASSRYLYEADAAAREKSPVEVDAERARIELAGNDRMKI